MDTIKNPQTIYSGDKIIYDHVRFENVQIIYDTRQDLEVEFVADLAVKGSRKDWIGIYEANWKDCAAFLVHQSIFGMPCDDSGRRRRIKFKSKWLKNAKPQTHYQFAYINKNLDIMGVSQYFQLKTEIDGSLMETSFSEKPCSSPVKEIKQGSLSQYLEIPLKSSPSNCRLYAPAKLENLCTSCHHCRGIFKLKESCEVLLTKQKEYQERIEDLQDRIKLLEKCLEWEKNKEQEKFKTYIWQISQAAFQHDANKSMLSGGYFDWDYSKKELYFKAVTGHQEITIQELQKVICELRLLEKPGMVSFSSEHFEDTVQTSKTEEKTAVEVCDLNNSSSEDES